MIHRLRIVLPALLLGLLVSAGCLLVSGQFVVTYNFKDHGYDPLVVNSNLAVAGVPVDLNSVQAYKDHKSELKDVVDLAIVGDVTNLDGTAPVAIEVWVATPQHNPLLATDASVRSAGQRVWGPLTLPAGGTKHIGWDESAKLFVGRQLLVKEIKTGGAFDLYGLGSNGYHFKIANTSLIAVISAGK